MQLPKQDLTNLFVTPGRDWSSKSIIAALDCKGCTLQDIEKELGFRSGAVRNVFYRRCGKYEEAIARKIGLAPEIIWPSRYRSDERLSA